MIYMEIIGKEKQIQNHIAAVNAAVSWDSSYALRIKESSTLQQKCGIEQAKSDEHSKTTLVYLEVESKIVLS